MNQTGLFQRVVIGENYVINDENGNFEGVAAVKAILKDVSEQMGSKMFECLVDFTGKDNSVCRLVHPDDRVLV